MKRLSLLFILVALWVAAPAHAISAFSRKEGIPCSGCHIRANRMNQTGLDYYRRGFRMSLAPAEATKESEEAKTKLGNYVSIQGVLDFTKPEHSAYKTSNKIALFGAGEVTPKFSFLAETTINPPDKQEVADLFVGYTTGTDDRYTFLRAGQMLPLITVDNPFEIANDRGATAFPRDRRQGVSAGYNVGKLWVEGLAVSSAYGGEGNSRDKIDLVANGQYTFTGDGTSVGGYYWAGNFNPSKSTTETYDRAGIVANYNEIKNVFLTAGYSMGKGDSASGGELDTSGVFAQAEYLFNDRWSGFVHAVKGDPNTDAGRDDFTTYTAAVNFWPTDAVTIQTTLTSEVTDADTHNAIRVRLRLMF